MCGFIYESPSQTESKANNLHMIEGEQEDSISISQSLRVD